MKYKILFLMAVLLLLTASAQTPASDSRTRLATTQIARDAAMHKARAAQDGPTLYTSMVVRFSSDDDLRRITDELGGVIYYTRADMALCCIPRDKVEELSRGHYVDSYAISRKASAKKLSSSRKMPSGRPTNHPIVSYPFICSFASA